MDDFSSEVIKKKMGQFKKYNEKFVKNLSTSQLLINFAKFPFKKKRVRLRKMRLKKEKINTQKEQ